MFTKHRIQQIIRSSSIGAWACRLCDETPTFALHWYAVLVVGFMSAIAVIGSAWVLVPSPHVQESTVATSTSVDIEHIQEAIRLHRERTAAFAELEATAPRVVDPGR